jgi:hypothetical protein
MSANPSPNAGKMTGFAGRTMFHNVPKCSTFRHLILPKLTSIRQFAVIITYYCDIDGYAAASKMRPAANDTGRQPPPPHRWSIVWVG